MGDLTPFSISLPGGINQSAPNPGVGDLEELQNFGIFRNRVGLRSPLKLIATLQDDQGTPADVDAVLDIVEHEGIIYTASWSSSQQDVYLHSMQVDGTTLTLEAVLWNTVVTAPIVKLVSFTGGTAAAGVSRLYATDYNQNVNTVYWDGSSVTTLAEDLDNSSSAENIAFSLLISFKFHLWGTGFYEAAVQRPEMIRFTQPGAIPATDPGGGSNPKEWFSSDHRSVGRRGDKIVAVSKAGDRLLLFQKRALHAIYGSGAATWNRQELSDVIGCVGPHAVASVDERVAYFWASDGPYRTDGNTIQYLGSPVRQLAVEADASELDTRVGYSPDDGLVYFIVSPGGADSYHLALVFDTRHDRWMKNVWLLDAAANAEFGAISFMDAAAAAGPEAAPNSPTATATTDTTLDVAWVNGDVNINTETHIYRDTTTGLTPNDVTNRVATVNSGVTTWTDTGLTQDTQYFYKIRHLRNSTHSSESSEVNDTTWLAEPVSVGLAGLTNGLIVSGTNKADNACIRIERKTLGNAFGLVTTLCQSSNAVKPTISNPEIEYDASTIVAADLSTVTVWEDQSGNNNDTADGGGTVRYLATGWDASTPALEFDDPGVDDILTFTAWGTGGPVTLFAVVEATDITNGMAIIGTSDGVNPDVGLYLYIKSDGTVGFLNGGDGATGHVTIESASGLVSNTDRLVISAKQDGVNGMTLRVNGTEVASTAASITPFPLWFNPRIHQAYLSSIPLNMTGDDGLIAFISGYSSAASTAQMGDMEAYLANRYSLSLAGFAIDQAFAYQNTGLTCGTTYFYRTRAEKVGSTDSEWTADVSREACAATTIATAPTAFTATAASATQINLAWTDNSDNEDSFVIHRSTDGGVTYSLLRTTLPNVVSYSDTGLTSNTEYYYKVLANNIAGQSAFTTADNATTTADLTTPSDLAVVAVSSSQVNLTWTDTAVDETAWEVYQSDVGTGGPYALVATLGAGSASHSRTGLSAATTYHYKIRATNGAQAGSYSNIANTTTGAAAAPNAPTMTSAIKNVGDTSTIIDIVWVDNSSDELNFELVRAAGGSYALVTSPAAGVQTYQDTGLTPGTEYTYKVRAVNAAGNSAFSATATETTDGAPAVPTDPTNLVATPDDADLLGVEVSAVDLTWTDNSPNEVDYQVERCTGASCTSWAVIATLAAGSEAYRDTGVTDSPTTGTIYRYRVRSRNATGNSAYITSGDITVEGRVTPGTPSLADTGYCDPPPSGSVATPQITVTWANGGDITGLEQRLVQRLQGAGGWTTIKTWTSAQSPSSQTSYVDSAVAAGVNHSYRIVDKHGQTGENTGDFTSIASTDMKPSYPNCSEGA